MVCVHYACICRTCTCGVCVRLVCDARCIVHFRLAYSARGCVPCVVLTIRVGVELACAALARAALECTALLCALCVVC